VALSGYFIANQQCHQEVYQPQSINSQQHTYLHTKTLSLKGAQPSHDICFLCMPAQYIHH
jgi:hypothetical protein